MIHSKYSGNILAKMFGRNAVTVKTAAEEIAFLEEILPAEVIECDSYFENKYFKDIFSFSSSKQQYSINVNTIIDQWDGTPPSTLVSVKYDGDLEKVKNIGAGIDKICSIVEKKLFENYAFTKQTKSYPVYHSSSKTSSVYIDSITLTLIDPININMTYPNASYLGLFITLPDADGVGGAEPSTSASNGAFTGYMRINLHDDIIYAENTLVECQQGASGEGIIKNDKMIMFPEVVNENWGTIVGFGIFDNDIPGEGIPYFWGQLESSATTEIGKVPLFRADEFQIILSQPEEE